MSKQIALKLEDVHWIRLSGCRAAAGAHKPVYNFRAGNEAPPQGHRNVRRIEKPRTAGRGRF